jgi:hypothetical protein
MQGDVLKAMHTETRAERGKRSKTGRTPLPKARFRYLCPHSISFPGTVNDALSRPCAILSQTTLFLSQRFQAAPRSSFLTAAWIPPPGWRRQRPERIGLLEYPA